MRLSGHGPVGHGLVVRPPSRRTASQPPLPPTADLVVVGAGVVGLAHALEAHARGHSVLVVERDPWPDGASARRSGHVAVTTQDTATLSCALASRERWLKLGREAGFRAAETGAVVVARSADELAVLDDLVATRDGDAHLLDAAGTVRQAQLTADDVVGGAFLPLDLRIDPRDALRSLAAALRSRPRADVAWSTTALTFEAGTGRTLVRTTRGEVVARRVLVAVGPDLDRLYPHEAARAGLRHDVRQVLQVTAPGRSPDPARPAVLGATTLLRGAPARSPALGDVRRRLRTSAPELLDADVHLTLTPHGEALLLGDARRPDADRRGGGLDRAPERSEAADDLLLREATALLGHRVMVHRRSSVPDVTVPRPRRGPFAGTPFVVTEPAPGVTTVTVANGLGTTTALGLAAKVVDGLL